jgi:hypothetical protein
MSGKPVPFGLTMPPQKIKITRPSHLISCRQKNRPSPRIGGEGLTKQQNEKLFGGVADGFHGAAFHGFLAQRLLLRRLGLFVNVGVPAIVIAGEIARSGFAAEIAVDALVIDVEFACDVLGIFVCDVSHNLMMNWTQKSGGRNYGRRPVLQWFFKLFSPGEPMIKLGLRPGGGFF